ncbi:MAG: IclR family transcriptional regulator [Rhodospirillales bacterium]|nr:IclR family transcriptional regulator [Rhodospirillales bacterium]
MAPPRSNHLIPADDLDALENGEGGERAAVQSVAIAAEILKTLAAQGGVLPLRALTAATGMPRAKVHRHLASLRAAGLVAQDPESGHYRIGPAAVTIGLVGLRLISPVRQLNEALPRLRDEINETVTAAIWGDRGPTIIAMEESDHVVTMNVRVGSTLPLLTSAIGRLFAAYLPDAVTSRAIAREQAAAAISSAEVAGLLGEIRAQRLSCGHGALLPGVDALAAPVFDHRGAMLAALCVVGRSESLDTKPGSNVARALGAAAERISQQLGFIEAT